MRELYAAEVTLVDAWLGHFLDRLAGLGLPEDTLLVVLIDHGVLLGEYGWVGKRHGGAHGAHPRALPDPPPGGKAKGRTSSYFASTHDIGPTVLTRSARRRPRAR